MQLKYCSITGADDAVRIEDLSALADKYPFLEVAVLLMPSRAGQPRFPSQRWIQNFAVEYSGANRAMHLCGEAFLGFVAGDQEVFDLMEGFQRIQLNLKFGDVDNRYDIHQMMDRIKANQKWQFIVQYAHDKNHILPLFDGVDNHAVLFDDSAGRGVSPDKWDAPIEGHFCGYAGGINPDNVQQNIDLISKVANGYTTWIDMESGVRTDDRFDLVKTRRVLEIASKYA